MPPRTRTATFHFDAKRKEFILPHDTVNDADVHAMEAVLRSSFEIGPTVVLSVAVADATGVPTDPRGAVPLSSWAFRLPVSPSPNDCIHYRVYVSSDVLCGTSQLQVFDLKREVTMAHWRVASAQPFGAAIGLQSCAESLDAVELEIQPTAEVSGGGRRVKLDLLVSSTVSGYRAAQERIHVWIAVPRRWQVLGATPVSEERVWSVTHRYGGSVGATLGVKGTAGGAAPEASVTTTLTGETEMQTQIPDIGCSSTSWVLVAPGHEVFGYGARWYVYLQQTPPGRFSCPKYPVQSTTRFTKRFGMEAVLVDGDPTPPSLHVLVRTSVQVKTFPTMVPIDERRHHLHNDRLWRDGVIVQPAPNVWGGLSVPLRTHVLEMPTQALPRGASCGKTIADSTAEATAGAGGVVPVPAATGGNLHSGLQTQAAPRCRPGEAQSAISNTAQLSEPCGTTSKLGDASSSAASLGPGPFVEWKHPLRRFCQESQRPDLHNIWPPMPAPTKPVGVVAKLHDAVMTLFGSPAHTPTPAASEGQSVAVPFVQTSAEANRESYRFLTGHEVGQLP